MLLPSQQVLLLSAAHCKFSHRPSALHAVFRNSHTRLVSAPPPHALHTNTNRRKAKQESSTAASPTPVSHRPSHQRVLRPPHRRDNKSHGGIPLGAVQIDAVYAQPFRDLVRRELLRSQREEEDSTSTSGTTTSKRNNKQRKNLRFRGVEPFIGPRNRPSSNRTSPFVEEEEEKDESSRSRLVLIHLPPLAATALDDGNPDLTAFLKECGGVYHPGLRRSRTHPNATKKKRNASIPTYVAPRPNINTNKLLMGKEEQEKKETKPEFTFSELFAGIGGFRLGLEALGGTCIFANEMDPYAASMYRRHFDYSPSLFRGDGTSTEKCHSLIEADILDLCAIRDMPYDVDVLTAGFPCQPFSSRGVQGGLIDERGQLYRELCRVLKQSHPKSFIFENVKGLVDMGTGGGGRYRGNGLTNKSRGEAGSVFAHLLQAFADCGYDVTWNICNSRHWVPQQRERVFIVGIREDLCHREQSDLAFSWQWYDRLLERSDHHGERVVIDDDAGVVRDILEPPDSFAVRESELSPTQWAKVQEVHTNKNGRMMAKEHACVDLDAKAPTLISSYRRSGNFTSKFIFMEKDGTTRVIPRFLTPRECARIMGFPEDFAVPSAGVDGDVVTAHFYSGIGNAVVPQVVEAVGKELLRVLRS